MPAVVVLGVLLTVLPMLWWHLVPSAHAALEQLHHTSPRAARALTVAVSAVVGFCWTLPLAQCVGLTVVSVLGTPEAWSGVTSLTSLVGTIACGVATWRMLPWPARSKPLDQ